MTMHYHDALVQVALEAIDRVANDPVVGDQRRRSLATLMEHAANRAGGGVRHTLRAEPDATGVFRITHVDVATVISHGAEG